MRCRHLAVLLVAAAAVAAQGEPAAKPPAKPGQPAGAPSDEARLQARVRADLQHIASTLSKTPHACRGEAHDKDHSTYTYEGTWRDGLRLLAAEQWQLLGYGTKVATRWQGRPWDEFAAPPEAHPKCPLAPADFVPHLATAELQAIEATSFGDRPAMRVHLRWTGEAAAAVCTAPAGEKRTAPVLASLKRLCLANSPCAVVDATVLFDPATKLLITSTLRLAVLPSDPPPEAGPAAQKAGLPAFATPAEHEVSYQLTMLPAAFVVFPPMSAELRAKLGLPPEEPAPKERR